MRREKLAIVHNTIAPYRHPLFESLSQDLDLMVYYCSVKHSSRKWDLWPRKYDYEYKILPRIPLRTPLGYQSLNLSIIKELILNKPHVLILSSYTDPTTWLALAIAKLLKIPLIYWTEGIKEPQSILGKISRPLRTLFIKKSGSIIVPGRLSKNYVFSLEANAEKVFIAPNVVDNELFIKMSEEFRPRKDELKSQLGLKGKIIVLYVGQLIKRKGVEYLLHAYRKLEQEQDNIALLVVGSGPSEYYLKELANALKIKNVQFISSGLNLRDLAKFFSTADIFVLPTLEDLWGFVINEAMACGLPIVATSASQAAHEMIHSGENGYLVKEASSEELYYAIKKIVTNSELRKQMGEKSREIIKREFEVSQMLQGFLLAIKYGLATKT